MLVKEIYDGYAVSKCGTVLGKRGKPMKHHDNGRGYPIVAVSIDGKRTSKGVHRMVAEAWLPNPLNLDDVNHKDCDKWNPSLDNLEWCTHGYNIAYSYEKLGRSALGEHNARCNTTEATVREICNLLSCGIKPSSVRDLGYDYGLVRSIKRRSNWQHISVGYAF